MWTFEGPGLRQVQSFFGLEQKFSSFSSLIECKRASCPNENSSTVYVALQGHGVP